MTAKRGKDLTIDEKIAFVVEMMHNRSFIRGRTAKKLAKEWGMSLRATQNITGHASKVVRLAINNPDLVAVDVGMALQEVLEDAIQDARAGKGDEDHRKRNDARKVVISAAKEWSAISGATAPTRLEIDDNTNTPERARAIMRGEFGHVTPDEKPVDE